MTALTQFQFDGHEVRAIMVDDEPWFIASDISQILGHRMASDMNRTLDEEDKATHETRTPGGVQETSIISEAGLYQAILQRQTGRMTDPGMKEFVRRFKRWVTGEVLPSIRRTGSYSVAPAPAPALTEAEIVHQALQITARQVEELTAENRRLAPKASRYETFLGADGDYSMRDAAQVLSRDHAIKVGQNRLAAVLRQMGWIDKRGIPYQDRIDAGHLRAKPRTRIHQRTGERVACDPQVRVTMRGLDLLAERLGGEKLVEDPR